ncbi:DNA-3-methyladenine glycosylase I [Rhodobacteraceae bacterium NNCM2]|nr:DNA-3-methyladenine glycosylase I [Coraliihabitans acroporae]
MRSFDELFEIAASRKGGPAAFEETLAELKTPAELATIPDDRWLSMMAKSVFRAGFNWKVIENKWPGFEEAFEGFDPGRWSLMSDDDLDRLLKDTRVVRHAKKLMAVGANAAFLRELAAEHGTAAVCFANWPGDDYVGLLEMLKKRGDRLGGTTGQYFLRHMGRDGFITGGDVATALIREGVVDKAPSSKRDMAAVQAAFSHWAAESGRPFAHISRTLACTVE